MPAPRGWHGKIRIASGDGRRETRGAPSKSRSADFAHGRSYRGTCRPTQKNKCHSPCDVLIDPRCVARASSDYALGICGAISEGTLERRFQPAARYSQCVQIHEMGLAECVGEFALTWDERRRVVETLRIGDDRDVTASYRRRHLGHGWVARAFLTAAIYNCAFLSCQPPEKCFPIQPQRTR
jgi:hypothetical protein